MFAGAFVKDALSLKRFHQLHDKLEQYVPTVRNQAQLGLLVPRAESLLAQPV